MGWNFREALFRRLYTAFSAPTPFKANSFVHDAPSTARSSLLPPNPRELLEYRTYYEVPLLNRRVDHESDTPLAALYRLYERIVLDQNIEMRNEIEAFWFHNEWLVKDIPDPKDPDPERYACLACVPGLLCASFNKRIELGLPRNVPAIFTRDQLDKWKAQERKYEQDPPWTESVPKLMDALVIPHWDNSKRDFVPLERIESEKASTQFAKKNILLWQPHIHFA